MLMSNPNSKIWVCLKMLCTPLYPMVFLIIIPMKNGYFVGNINPTFSDKPIWPVYKFRCQTHIQDATKLEYSHYVKYIEERFPLEVPQMFGLPPALRTGVGWDSTVWNLGTVGDVKKPVVNFWESHETCDTELQSSFICGHGMWTLNCGQAWQF